MNHQPHTRTQNHTHLPSSAHCAAAAMPSMIPASPSAQRCFTLLCTCVTVHTILNLVGLAVICVAFGSNDLSIFPQRCLTLLCTCVTVHNIKHNCWSFCDPLCVCSQRLITLSIVLLLALKLTFPLSLGESAHMRCSCGSNAGSKGTHVSCPPVFNGAKSM